MSVARAAALALLAFLIAAPARPAVQEGAAASADAGTPPLPGATVPADELLNGRPLVKRVVFEGADATGLRALVPIQDGAPLDARDVRDAVRALHASARFSRVAAFAEEVPGATPKAVQVIFVLAPVKKLTLVTFRGNKVLAESILHQTANLQVNAELQPELVQRAVEAIKAAYYRVGYRQVTIASLEQEIDNGIQLTLAIDEGRATKITQVLFTGELGLGGDELLAAFKLGQGDVLNLGLVDEGVKGVRDHYRQAGRLRARVDAAVVAEVAPGAARITVPVQAGPRVRFHVRGNDSFTDSLLVSKLAVDGEEPLDVQMAQDLAQRLRRFYVQAGFASVKIAWREIRTSDDAVELVFSVEEGPQTRVEQIVFSGNLGMPSSQLRERVVLQLTDAIGADPAFGADPGELARRGVMGRPPGQPPERLRVDPETVFDPVLYAHAIKQIEDLYKSQGYLSVQAGPAKLEQLEKKAPAAAAPPADPKSVHHPKAPYPLPVERMRVVIPIKEGERSMVSLLVIEGGSEVKAEVLDRAVTLRKGGPFSYYSAEEGRSAIAAAFTREGYFYAKVEDDEIFYPPGPADEPGTARVEVRYRVQAGPLVHVAFVEVVGQRHTQEQLILDLIKLKPGDVLTPDGLDKGQQQLLLTGLFFSATLTPRNPEVAEPEKTVLVQVRERPRRELQTSFGFSLEDGPRTSVQFTFGNLFGRNLTFNALARANLPYQRLTKQLPCVTTRGPDGIDRQECPTTVDLTRDPVERVIDLGISVPRLEPLTDLLRASIDFIHERDIRYTYNLTKWFSVQLSTALNRSQPFAASLTYEVGFQVLDLGTRTLEQQLTGQDAAVFRQPAGSLIFGSLRPTLTLDLRDDLARPRAGFYLQAVGDLLNSLPIPLTGSHLDVKLLKLQGLVAGYLPLPGMASLVVSARAGRVFKLDGETGPSVVPGDRRFYLGGATTLRGFHQDALQPADVIDRTHELIDACNKAIGNYTLSPGSQCNDKVKALQAGTSSDGGLVMVAFGAELRVPLLTSLEIAFFLDAGNLWLDPSKVASLGWERMRKAVGVGLRYLTPIGRIAVDIGINLAPDVDLGDPPWYPYFAIDSL